jgi:hypothetical protein
MHQHGAADVVDQFIDILPAPSSISAEMHLATKLWREIARPSRSSRFKHAASAAEARGSMTAVHECASPFKGRRCQKGQKWKLKSRFGRSPASPPSWPHGH